MLGILIVALLAVGSVSTTQVQHSVPLLTKAFSTFFNDTLPCVGPCLLDKAETIAREIERGEQSNFYQCGKPLIDRFRNLMSQQDGFNLLQFLGNNTEVCPVLRTAIDCLYGNFSGVCGSGISEKLRQQALTSLRFFDCDVPENERLRIMQCIMEPTMYNSQNQTKAMQLGSCVSQHTSFLSRWPQEYMANDAFVLRVAEAVTGMKNCFFNFIRPQLDDNTCQKVEMEMELQFNALINYAKSSGILICLGNPRLYTGYYGTLTSCTQRFVEVMRSTISQFGRVYAGNVDRLINFLSSRTCSNVKQLETCYKSLLGRQECCNRVVLPTLEKVVRPSVNYFNCRSGRSSCGCNKYDDQCACLENYTVRKDIITCPKVNPFTTTRSRPLFTSSFNTFKPFTTTTGPPLDVLIYLELTVSNRNYDHRDFSRLVEDFRPAVDRAMKRRFGDAYIASVGYRGRQGSVVITFGALFKDSFRGSADTVTRALEDAQTGGSLIGNSGDQYIIKPGSIQASQEAFPTPGEEEEGYRPQMGVLIAISVVGLLLLIILITVIIVALCCCRCRARGNQEPDKRKIIETSHATAPPGGYTNNGAQPAFGEVQKVPL